MASVIALRDSILESLRCEFRRKVRTLELTALPGVHLSLGPAVEKLLTDMANNIAQGLLTEEILAPALEAARG